jgi:hypothetical protein
MTVHRLYKNKPFEPEAIAAMTSAYADICHELGLSEGDRPEIHAVAKKVIEFAQRGDRDSGSVAGPRAAGACRLIAPERPINVSKRAGRAPSLIQLTQDCPI